MTTPRTIPSDDSQKTYVSESAQKRLDALRSSVEIRLAALEAALADPQGGSSLGPLISDLARVATEEAQAAAAHACADTRLDADTRIAQTRAAAQATVEAERSVTAQTGRALDQARQRIDTLERETREKLQESLRAFEAERTRERTAADGLLSEAARLERSVASLQNELQSVRSSTRDLQHELDRANAQLIAHDEAHATAMAAGERIEVELARERDELTRARQAQVEIQEQLQAERTANAEMRQAASLGADRLRALGVRESEARAAGDRIAAELAREQQLGADSRRTRSDLQARLDAERAAGRELSQNATRAAAQLAAELALERQAATDLLAEHVELQQRFDTMQAASAEQSRAATGLEARMAAAVATERAAAGDVREAAARAESRFASLGQEASETSAAYEQLTIELESERRTSAGLRRMQAGLQGQLDAGQAAAVEIRETSARDKSRFDADLDAAHSSTAALRSEMEQAADRLSALETQRQQTQASNAETHESLAFSRAEVEALRDDLERARTRVEHLAGERADAERTWKDAEARLQLMTRERDELAIALDASRPAIETPLAARDAQGEAPANSAVQMLPDRADDTSAKVATVAAKAEGTPPETGWVGVRMATRYRFPHTIDVQINGGTGQLRDLSVGGCQIHSSTPLKPNQAVKVVLPCEPKPISCSGKVVWATLEAPVGGPSGYRAGVEFKRPDEHSIETFIIQHGALA